MQRQDVRAPKKNQPCTGLCGPACLRPVPGLFSAYSRQAQIGLRKKDTPRKEGVSDMPDHVFLSSLLKQIRGIQGLLTP